MPPTLEEALKLATTILRSEKSTSESLAELLTAIYDSTLESKELKQMDKLSIRTNPLSRNQIYHVK